MDETLLNLDKLKIDIIEHDEKSLEFYNFLLFDLRRSHGSLQSSYNLHGLLQLIDDLDVHCGDPKISSCLLQNLHHTIFLTCTSDILKDCGAFFNIEKDTLYQYRYQILNTMMDMKIIDQIDYNSDIFQSLITKIYSGNKRTRDWCIVCIRVILENSSQDADILDKIWDLIKKSSDTGSSYTINIEILSNFIDFYNKRKLIIREKELWNIIFTILNSYPDINSRKSAIFVIKRIVNYLPCAEELNIAPEISGLTPINVEKVKTSWNTFTVIFETLDENQSHLILPSLKMLHQINLDRRWKEILYRHLLRHKNSLVLKWIIQYIFEKYKASDLTEGLLREFLISLNNTFLYAENNINSELFKNFIDVDVNSFMNIVALIDWKSVPMFVCFKGLEIGNHNFEDVSDSALHTIASLIRKLQNKTIRNVILKMFLNLFDGKFNKSLNLCFAILKKFHSKSFGSIIINSILTREFTETTKIDIEIIEIVNNYIVLDDRTIVTFLKTVNDLRDILKCYYIVGCSHLQSLLEEHIQNKYKFSLDIYNVRKPYNTEDFITLFIAHHKTEIKNENRNQIEKLSLDMIEGNFNFVNESIYTSDWSKLKKMFVDSFTTFLKSTDSLDLLINNCEMFLDKGGYRTVDNICDALKSPNLQQKIKTEIIDRLLTEIKVYWKALGFQLVGDMCCSLTRYFITLDKESCIHFITKLLDLDSANGDLIGEVFEVLKITKPDVLVQLDFISLITRGILFGEPLHGDQKIEFDFSNILPPQNYILEYTTLDVRVLCFVILQALKEYKTLHLSLKEHLLDLSRKLNEKKPRYFHNSKQHRIKLRIVQALALIHQFHETYDEKYLIAITDENNQLDVTIIMELLIAKTIPSENLMILLDKINTCTNSVQPSIFAIAFMSCRFRKSRDDANKIIVKLLPFIMGQHFTTRFYAQVTIYHLIKYFNFDHLQYLYDAIEKSMKQGNSEQNLRKLNNDFRYNFLLFDDNSLYNEQIILQIIPKMTNMATDEVALHKPFPWSNDSINIESLEPKQSITIKNVEIQEFRVTDVQKKVIPIKTELNEELLIYSDKEDIEKKNRNDIIVVASLITKAPNLGGIARTCEVLGLKIMTLDSLRYIENIEFKTLSMTAEKWLNLIEVKSSKLHEFLMQKKLEGYSIVGAEQTANSYNFAHFKFPKRMVLLLGHEKEGIPANLISLLDYAVEIPQQGMVRSLNVHVTGALFMWEYYKQHLQSTDLQ